VLQEVMGCAAEPGRGTAKVESWEPFTVEVAGVQEVKKQQRTCHRL